jgi:mRNA interferase RelE/StbE
VPSAQGGEDTSGRELYGLVVPRPVARAIGQELPEPVAWAVIEFINGPLLENPYRAGAELRGKLAGSYSAHLSTFRIQYRIDEEGHTVTVVQVKHRRDAYGPGSHP